MKCFSLALIRLTLASLQLSEAYLVAPPGTAAPGATADCSAWTQDTYGLTCAVLEKYYGFTEAQFQEWNPSTAELGDGCNMIQGLYYCVQVNYIALTTSKTSTSTSTLSSSATSSAITTPTPTQTGMANNCDNFYLVVSGDTCYDIAAAEGIPLDDFYAWNPAVGTSCASLQAGYYVCVGVASGSSGTTTTTTSSTLSTSTVSTTKRTTTITKTTTTSGAAVPSPTQSGLASNCNDFYLVVSGDGCYNLATSASISLDDFYSWNPAVEDDCSGLQAGYYVCIGIE